MVTEEVIEFVVLGGRVLPVAAAANSETSSPASRNTEFSELMVGKMSRVIPASSPCCDVVVAVLTVDEFVT